MITKPFVIPFDDDYDDDEDEEEEEDRTVLVIPILSWYHSSWDTEPDIPGLDLPPVRLAGV